MSNEIPRRYLIVNADDFGMGRGVNDGIIKSHEHGIVTSASLMVRWPAAVEAAAYARQHPKLSVGLHIDLCEWAFVNETWQPVYEVVPTDSAPAVAEEVGRQLEAFRRLMGCHPTHLDSHQHVHRTEPVLSVMQNEARKLGVVLRSYCPDVRYCGEFYGQSDKGCQYPEGISVRGLEKILRNLPAGTTELACHPGFAQGLESAYREERGLEIETLCNPRIRSAIGEEAIVLRSFSDGSKHGAFDPRQ